MREQFKQEMKDIHAEVVDIAVAVSDITRSAVTSLIEGDVDKANAIIAADDAIDVRCVGVEERVLETIATQFPVARDLRLLQSLAFIAMHLERMADLGSNIAKATKRVLCSAPPASRVVVSRSEARCFWREGWKVTLGEPCAAAFAAIVIGC